MRLLPSEQTAAQLDALKTFVEAGNVGLHEPCNCGGQVRHNNGGNYHDIVEFRLDAGQCWRNQTSTSDYAPADDWSPVAISAAVDEIAALAATGYRLRRS